MKDKMYQAIERLEKEKYLWEAILEDAQKELKTLATAMFNASEELEYLETVSANVAHVYGRINAARDSINGIGATVDNYIDMLGRL